MKYLLKSEASRFEHKISTAYLKIYPDLKVKTSQDIQKGTNLGFKMMKMVMECHVSCDARKTGHQHPGKWKNFFAWIILSSILWFESILVFGNQEIFKNPAERSDEKWKANVLLTEFGGEKYKNSILFIHHIRHWQHNNAGNFHTIYHLAKNNANETSGFMPSFFTPHKANANAISFLLMHPTNTNAF